MSLEEIRSIRLLKLEKLKQAGVNPYPVSACPDVTLEEAVDNFAKLAKKKRVTLAGRIIAKRGQGAILFVDIFDGTGKFQAVFKKDEMEESVFGLFEETTDNGDFIEVSGSFFTTKRKEKSLLAKDWKMLCKTLRPLPEKWHGLTDTEERFRKRYLDILMNEEVRKRFVLRSRIVSELRKVLDKENFLEVETSMLQPLAGGANAEPFKTRHNALDMDLYLRIAPEIDLKKLLIGGYRKVYEIGRSFRNEGIDVTHNPEFTTVEWYEAYSDAKRQREFLEKVLKTVVKGVVGKNKIEFDAKEIDFSGKFAVVSYFELLQRYALIPEPAKASMDDLKLKATQLGIKPEKGDTVEKLMDSIYKKTARPKLVQPTFVVDYPANYIPLAKKKEGSDTLVDAFQLVIGGFEVTKAFSELNDPVDQRERFALQEKNKKEGDAEAQEADEAFLEALEYGMPPAGGVGLSIDRMAMLLGNVKNIREVVFFPTMRPKT
ncbi:MAG: lysine--tRNA ligase [bacterium]|nr:lysine--tRNA ligase [bacterium]